jgi:hypothetical protein
MSVVGVCTAACSHGTVQQLQVISSVGSSARVLSGSAIVAVQMWPQHKVLRPAAGYEVFIMKSLIMGGNAPDSWDRITESCVADQ